jgi:lipopolysaccharide/colanic/teichoic acid biosynthesis glycosyltransferase
VKRVFDIFCSFIILIIFLPFGILIALFVLFDSRGGVFYVQERVGKDQKPFGLIKFRTMFVNSEKEGKLTVGMNDYRITRIGRFLRRSKLDEFPQFFNVLIGDMSIVGPRPEIREYVALYSDEQKIILNFKPGITDVASLEYYRENEILGAAEDPEKTYIEEIMPAKIELNKKYIKNASIGQDIKIMWRTVLRMFA